MSETPPTDRGSNGRFAAGNPGGPGRPKGKSHELQRAAQDAVTTEHMAALMRKALRLGLEGNLSAMRLVFERTCGRAADAPVESEPLGIALPRLRTAADCNLAIEKVVEGICNGTVNREAATLLIDAIQMRLKAIEVDELETRLVELEQAAASVEHRGVRRTNRRF